MLLLNDHNGISKHLIIKSTVNKTKTEVNYRLPIGEHPVLAFKNLDKICAKFTHSFLKNYIWFEPMFGLKTLIFFFF